MRSIESVSINNEKIHVFDYVWFVYDSDEGNFWLNLEMIVTEVVPLKLKANVEKRVKVGLHYNDGQEQTFMMSIDHATEVGNAEIPNLELSVKINNPEEFPELKVVNCDTPGEEWPKLRSDITIQEIRKVEMPNREVDITASLPIDQEEWMYRNEDNIGEILKEAIYDYWRKQASNKSGA